MHEGLFEQISIICPKCRQSDLQSSLRLERVFKRDRDFVLDGLLFCPYPQCQTKYPILSGVPIVLREIESWMKCNTGKSISDLNETFEIENFVNTSRNGDNIAASSISTYIESHYSTGLVAASSFAVLDEFWKKVIEMAHSGEYKRALDLGCSVGRYTFELARCSGLAVGIDLNFMAVAAAANIQRTQMVTYERRIRGKHYETTQIPYLAPPNALFLVANVLDPPLTADSFDVVAGLNVLDNVKVPLILIGQMDALLNEAGDLILSSPYEWHANISDTEEWLETDDLDAPEMLREILKGNLIPKMALQYNFQQEFLEIPWILRNHNRHWSLFMVHLIKARKCVKLRATSKADFLRHS